MSFFEFPHTRTYDSDLGWLIKCCKSVSEAIEALEKWKEEVQPQIDDFLALWKLIEAGQLPPAIQNAIREWMRVNAIDLVGELVKSVYFGITDAGYFVAYIPENWEEITFNTTEYDFHTDLQPQYGHLVLSY